MNQFSHRRQGIRELRDYDPAVVTEHFKERIYATITLLALLAVMWQTAEHLTPLGAAASVGGTVLALWLAVGIASRMAYHAAHGKQMSTKEYGNVLWAHSALLATAVPALLLIGVAGIGLLSLKVSLFISMLLLLLSFVMFSFFAGRRIHTTWGEILITSSFEIALGVGVIALKIVVGH